MACRSWVGCAQIDPVVPIAPTFIEGNPVHDHTQRRTAGRGRRLLVIAVAVALATGLLATMPAANADDPVDEVNELVSTVVDLVNHGLLPPRNTGAGYSTGAITYTTGTKLPKAFGECEYNLEFKLGDGTTPNTGWASDAFVFNTVISGFAGPVTMTGGGDSDTSCESYSSGGGVMTVDLRGKAQDNPTGSTLDCRDDYPDQDPVTKPKSQSLSGRYTRVLSNMVVILTGKCLVNSFATGQVTFVAVVQAVPADVQNGEGVTGSVERLTTAGAFVLVPF
jgi:hypothetical protein